MSSMPPAPVPAVRDHSRLAGGYLIALGVFQLLGCNLGGLLFIWFGQRVRERREGFRKAALWLLGLHSAAMIFILAWVALKGAEGMTLGVFGWEWPAPRAWLMYALATVGLGLFGLPFYWLSRDSYQQPAVPSA